MKGTVNIDIKINHELTADEKQVVREKLEQYIGYVNDALLTTVRGIEGTPLVVNWENNHAN